MSNIPISGHYAEIENSKYCQSCRQEYRNTLFLATQTQQTWTKIAYNTKNGLPQDSTIPLLKVYPKDAKSAGQRDACPPLLIAIQLTIPKIQNETRLPPADDWIKHM